ncbi:ganglioside GM2 activator-like [Haliotis cracherodii]|uniref:ganglioside GM2 activator-like n=1 Tax=Haliotis cracherodii TaxID=6455 RepID=UPI0039E91B15
MATHAILGIISLILVSHTSAKSPFKVVDCSQNKTRELFSITDAHLDPKSVAIPGNLTVWGSVNVSEPIEGNITLDLMIERKLGFFWLEIESDKYDFCDLIGPDVNKTVKCPKQLAENDIPCECPFPPGTYALKHHELFTIKKISKSLQWLVKGDYRLTLKLEDSGTDDELSCQQIYVSIRDGSPPTPKPECSFLDCIFG